MLLISNVLDAGLTIDASWVGLATNSLWSSRNFICAIKVLGLKTAVALRSRLASCIGEQRRFMVLGLNMDEQNGEQQ
jgi:hypothetical protein